VGSVGPAELRFKNRIGFAGVLVIGDQVLLIPKTRTLDVIPHTECPFVDRQDS